MKKKLFQATILISIPLLISCTSGKENELTAKQKDNEKNQSLNEKRLPSDEIQEIKDGTYQINGKESSVNWEGTATAKSHKGKIYIKEGFIVFSSGSIIEGKVTMDMTSIKDEKGNLALEKGASEKQGSVTKFSFFPGNLEKLF
jgi:hypothetical protein